MLVCFPKTKTTVELKKNPYPYETKTVNAIAEHYLFPKWKCNCSLDKDKCFLCRESYFLRFCCGGLRGCLKHCSFDESKHKALDWTELLEKGILNGPEENDSSECESEVEESEVKDSLQKQKSQPIAIVTRKGLPQPKSKNISS